MKDYRPLDLSKRCNCGIKVFGDRKPPLGSQSFHGLPFVIGGGALAVVTIVAIGLIRGSERSTPTPAAVAPTLATAAMA